MNRTVGHQIYWYHEEGSKPHFLAVSGFVCHVFYTYDSKCILLFLADL